MRNTLLPLFLCLVTQVAFAGTSIRLSDGGPFEMQMKSEVVDSGYHSHTVRTLRRDICRIQDPCTTGEYWDHEVEETISIPYSNWQHDVDALIKISVGKIPESAKVPDLVKVELEGEKLRLSIDERADEDHYLIADYKLKRGEMDRRLLPIDWDVVISATPIKPLKESVTIKNLKFSKGILSYETGVEGVLPVEHFIVVKIHKFLAGKEWSGSIAAKDRNVKEVPGGLLHTVDFKKFFSNYKGGKATVRLMTSLENYDSALKVNKIISAQYRSPVKDDQTVKGH